MVKEEINLLVILDYLRLRFAKLIRLFLQTVDNQSCITHSKPSLIPGIQNF